MVIVMVIAKVMIRGDDGDGGSGWVVVWWVKFFGDS